MSLKRHIFGLHFTISKVQKLINNSEFTYDACAPVKQCRSLDHYTASSSPAVANVFVSLGKILSLNGLVDLNDDM